MLGVAGGGGGSNIPDIDYINEDYYCLTLNFEDNILVSYSATDRKEDEGC